MSNEHTISFSVNPETITAGQAATLKWDVEGVREVYLDGQGVTGHETRTVRPATTRTYTLHVVLRDGSTVDHQVMVTVEGAVIDHPTATRPPTVILTAENSENLKAFPRPPQDNGIGLHFHVDLRDAFITRTVPRLKSIRATWTLIFAQDELQAKRAAAACWPEGIMPVVRIGKLVDEPFDPIPYVDALREVGAPPYVQIYNEPEDEREWENGDRPPNWAQIFGRNWARQAVRVFDAGGFPGIQVLDRSGFDEAVNHVAAMGRQDIWKKAFFVHHNYGSNHPPDYPYDERNQRDNPGQTILQDYICVLKFLAHAAWMQERIGFVLPIIGGEGGWVFGSEEDGRYSKVERALHARYHAEMFQWFRTGMLSNGEPLPDYLFSITPWIAGSFTFAGQNWWDNILVPEGKLTDTIEAVRAIPPFVRRFSWDEETGQPEPQEPEPEEPKPEEPKPEEPEPQPLPLQWDSRLDELGVRVERSESSPAWRLVSATYLDENESSGKHNAFFTALNADGGPAANVRFTLDWKGRRADENPCITTTGADGKADCPIFTMLRPELKDGPSFGTTVDEPGDVVRGMGLPMNRHVGYLLTYRFGV